MRFDSVIYLLGITYDENDIGDTIQIPARRQVFAEKKSIRQSEYYQASATGLRPEIMFVMRALEYGDEQQLEFEGKTYNIIRPFAKGELVEIICQGVVNRGTT